MPRPPTDAYWVQQVKELYVNEPRYSAARIAELLEQQSAREGHPDPPSRSTVQRMLKRWRDEPPADLDQHRYVRWPESFAAGLLPWESARVVLDLLQSWPYPDRRPTVRLAQWVWRVRLAAPSAPWGRSFTDSGAAIGGVYDAAYDLAESEAMDVPRRDIEGWLVFEPWRNADAAETYLSASESTDDLGSVPIPRYEPGRMVIPRDGVSEAAMRAAMRAGGLIGTEDLERAVRWNLALAEEAAQQRRFEEESAP